MITDRMTMKGRETADGLNSGQDCPSACETDDAQCRSLVERADEAAMLAATKVAPLTAR